MARTHQNQQPAPSVPAGEVSHPHKKCEVDKKRKQKENEKEKEKRKEKEAVNEIEEIFRVAKKKRKELTPPASPSTAETKANKKSAMKMIKKEPKKSEDKLSSRKRRKTAEGLSLYSAEELGIGNPDAGDTPLCPFDCSCCF